MARLPPIVSGMPLFRPEQPARPQRLPRFVTVPFIALVSAGLWTFIGQFVGIF